MKAMTLTFYKIDIPIFINNIDDPIFIKRADTFASALFHYFIIQ